MQKNERWGGVSTLSGNPSARLRAARSMPQWMETRGSLPTPPPPPSRETESPMNDPDYEVIDLPSQAYSNTIPTTIEVRVKRCELCGASGPSVICEQCPQQSFCPSCDEMYHRHPKRQSHMRRAIVDTSRSHESPRPPLPPKGEGMASPAPVPPPRRNKKNQLPPGSSSTLKRDTSIVGSIKRIITGGKAVPPPRPSPLSRDRSASLLNNNIDFTRTQMMMGGDMENGWGRGSRMGSMNALNMQSPFGPAPMIHAQSMAHLGCPNCWGWGSQAALHQPGMHGPNQMHNHGMMPPPPHPYWYPSWDPRRQRRPHHGRPSVDSSSEDEEHLSPALSRRSMRGDSDSDDSFKKSMRPHSRRESFSDLKRRDDDTMSLRGGRIERDDDTRSLRGQRRDSLRRRDDGVLDRGARRNRRFDDTGSERGSGLRRAEDLFSERERGGTRRRQDDLFSEDRTLRRRDDDTFSERGGRITQDTKYRDDDSWERSSKKSDRSDKKYQRETSWEKQIDKRKDRYLSENESDRKPKMSFDKKNDRLQDPYKHKEDKKGGLSPTKSIETISSQISSTSGEDRTKVSKRDRFLSDTGQQTPIEPFRNQTSTQINTMDEPPQTNLLDEKEIDEIKDSEDDMKPLGPIPIIEWECQHCTYVNRPGNRVCEVCCKTRTVDAESTSVAAPTATSNSYIVEEKVKEEVKEISKVMASEPPPPQLKRQEPEKKKENRIEATNGTQMIRNISLSSKGTSPPPQSISTQTYDVAGLGVKKSSPEVGWSSPRRSFSRQSVISDTVQSGISPTRSRSPGETDSQMTDTKPARRNDLTSTLTRKPSKAGSLANEQTNTMVQKQVNQGLEMVKLLREAEDVGFSGEEVSVAVEHCGDGSPLQWLIENWAHMIDTVVTLATNYGHERKENTIGTVSEKEARAALIMHQGSVWSAVTEVVQQRQNKYGELLSRGNFSREDIVTALTAHHGDLEAAYTELTKGQLKPFLRRMWAPNNHIGELDELRAELDPSGRVQSWLTQHVYQSIPKPKPIVSTPATQLNRRHSDVHRFLNEVLSSQTPTQPYFVENRYGSLHNLTGKAGRGQVGSDFGAPPERYSSCLNLHEASTRIDLSAPRLYMKQQRPSFYPSRAPDDNRSVKFAERQISMPDHLQEYKEKILFDRQVSAPEEPYYSELEASIGNQASKWKNIEMTELADMLQNEIPADDRSEIFGEFMHRDEDYEEHDERETKQSQEQICNGRLQILINRNQKKKRRPRRTIKSYHSRFNLKSDMKNNKIDRDEEIDLKENQSVAKQDDIKIKQSTNEASTSLGKLIKDSTDEYESVESSEDESKADPVYIKNNNSVKPKNERIITIEREVSENNVTVPVKEDKIILNDSKTPEVSSDIESVGKPPSDEIIETDYKEHEGSFSNSIPFIDDDEVFSEGNEEALSTDKTTNLTQKAAKEDSIVNIATESNDIEESKSESSSKYLSITNTLETESNLTQSNLEDKINHNEQNDHEKREERHQSNAIEKTKQASESQQLQSKSTTADEYQPDKGKLPLPGKEIATGNNSEIEETLQQQVEESSDDEYEYVEVNQESLDGDNDLISTENQSLEPNEISKTTKNEEKMESKSENNDNGNKTESDKVNDKKRENNNKQSLDHKVPTPESKTNSENKKSIKDLQTKPIKAKENISKTETESKKSKDVISTEKGSKEASLKFDNSRGIKSGTDSKINTKKDSVTKSDSTVKSSKAVTSVNNTKNSTVDSKVNSVKSSLTKPVDAVKTPLANTNSSPVKSLVAKSNARTEKMSNVDSSIKKNTLDAAKNKSKNTTSKSIVSPTKPPSVNSSDLKQILSSKTKASPTDSSTAISKGNSSDLASEISSVGEMVSICSVETVQTATTNSNKSRKDIKLEETKQNGNNDEQRTNPENSEIVHIEVKVTGDTEQECSDKITEGSVQLNSNDNNTSMLTPFALDDQKTKIKIDESLSPVPDVDESSDKDISPIPTDSEGDKSRNMVITEGSVLKDSNNKETKNREEMVTLIKQSLSKDVVLDRLVGTILGALQGEGEPTLKRQDLAAVFLTHQSKQVTEIPVTETAGNMVTALQIAQDISINPKEAMQETILQTDAIKISSDMKKDESQLKNEEFQREVRKVLAEGLVTSYPQAELVVNLMELKFTAEEAIQAAADCTSLQSAIAFLHQECPLCANKCTIKEMVGMLECDHRCCRECAQNYFVLKVTEGSVWDCVCPFCRLPNLKISSQDQAQVYFSHLDILLKGLLPEATHELFQRKLRDWTLAQDPNFKWCTKCSSGFIANPHQKVLMCPDCRSITCAKCRKPWEGGHEATCEQLEDEIEPENLLNKHLEEEGITCPSCKARYTLARGGCMHMTCTGCKHEFCSGCSKPFLMGDRCQVSEYCPKLGLHAHHPRNCLFYLRDKEPQVLEQLLKESNVDFSRKEDEENTSRCKVSLLKETDDGMLETECNHPIHAQALCRTHYVEHLVRLVKVRKLDPVTVMDLTEAQQELRRRGKKLPDRLPRQCDQSYLLTLIKIVQEEIPLE